MKSLFTVSVLVSNFAGLGIEAKVKIGLGFGLAKILQSRSWSRTSRPRLQPCTIVCEDRFFSIISLKKIDHVLRLFESVCAIRVVSASLKIALSNFYAIE